MSGQPEGTPAVAPQPKNLVCPKCHGNGYILNRERTVRYGCFACGGKGEAFTSEMQTAIAEKRLVLGTGRVDRATHERVIQQRRDRIVAAREQQAADELPA